MRKFRLLLVEDDKHTNHELLRLLVAEFPGSRVASAMTAAQARQIVQASVQEPFDLAILDFQIPEREGVNAEIDPRLCELIRASARNTKVAHITAFPKDPLVKKHLNEFHQDWRDPQAIVVSKLNTDWPEQLLRHMKTYLFGLDIEERLGDLVTVSSPDNSQRLYRTGTHSGRGSLTMEVAQLCRDIARHWDDLDERTQGRIKSVVHVNADVKPVRVSLL